MICSPNFKLNRDGTRDLSKIILLQFDVNGFWIIIDHLVSGFTQRKQGTSIQLFSMRH